MSKNKLIDLYSKTYYVTLPTKREFKLHEVGEFYSEFTEPIVNNLTFTSTFQESIGSLTLGFTSNFESVELSNLSFVSSFNYTDTYITNAFISDFEP